jgi:hypothetical protein
MRVLLGALLGGAGRFWACLRLNEFIISFLFRKLVIAVQNVVMKYMNVVVALYITFSFYLVALMYF